MRELGTNGQWSVRNRHILRTSVQGFCVLGARFLGLGSGGKALGAIDIAAWCGFGNLQRAGKSLSLLQRRLTCELFIVHFLGGTILSDCFSLCQSSFQKASCLLSYRSSNDWQTEVGTCASSIKSGQVRIPALGMVNDEPRSSQGHRP